ncbi:MAG: glutamate racemase [Candidatus Aureabacteria bacterium]|nr:glutamate racemase [Candidatus Auribacterota bacterium]
MKKKTVLPVGIFDSGVGGLTVLKEIIKILPGEDIVYFGDTARVPYGTKSPETIKRFAAENCDFLLQNHVKAIIAACNTVSSVALPYIESRVNVPVIDVVKPAVETALALSKSKRIGIIGTKATISSGAYEKRIKELCPRAIVFSKACPLFVPLVEENILRGKILDSAVKMYLEGFRLRKIDALILGCTHYPLIKKQIKVFMGARVHIVDSARASARKLADVLAGERLKSSQKRGKVRFYVSDSPESFRCLGRKFLGCGLGEIKVVREEVSYVWSKRGR